MIFSPSNANDVKKYFEGTFVKFKELGEQILYIDRVTSENVLCHDGKDNVFELVLDQEAPYEMQYSLPHRGMFEYMDSVFQLQRIPARQWKKGITGDNTRIIRMTDNKPMTIGFELLEAFTNKPAYTHISRALLDKEMQKRPAIALSCRMWYMPKKNLIYADSKPVAYFDPKQKTIGFSDSSKMFSHEINTLMKDDVEAHEIKVEA